MVRSLSFRLKQVQAKIGPEHDLYYLLQDAIDETETTKALRAEIIKLKKEVDDVSVSVVRQALYIEELKRKLGDHAKV